MAQQFDVYEGAIFAVPCTARTSEIERSLSRTLSDYASYKAGRAHLATRCARMRLLLDPGPQPLVDRRAPKEMGKGPPG